MSSPTPPDAYVALRIPALRRFAAGRVAGVIGSQMVTTALGWQLYERTRDPWSLGLVGLVELVPVVGLAIPAGALVDRLVRRNVAIAAHLSLAMCCAALALLTWSDAPTPLFYVVAFGLGLSNAFRSPSVSSLIPQLVPQVHFVNANAWLSTVYEVSSMAGPALGGMLIAALGGATGVHALGFLLHLINASALATLPAAPPQTTSKVKSTDDLLAGLRFVLNQPLFLSAITLDLFAVLLGGAVALLPVFARDVLDVGPMGLGWLRAAPALGAFSTALVTTRLPPWKRPGVVLLWVVTGFGLATIGFGLSRSFPLSLACLFLTGMFDEVSVVIRQTLEQTLTPDGMRGRVSAIHGVFIGLSNEMGAFESGSTAALFGPVASVVGGGVGTLLVVLLVARFSPQLRALPPLHELKPLEG